MKKSKRYNQAKESVDEKKTYSFQEALDILKSMPRTKFDETVEITARLGADPKKSDQMIRGSVVLPHGTGKKIKVLVFCESDKEADAKAAGADFVGGQDMIDKIAKENWLDFDACIATPSMMKNVSRLGKVLGPRGLMPSPKTGSVTENVAGAVKEAKAGKIDFRMDKLGCVAVGMGKISFSKEALIENFNAFLEAFLAARPQSLKGEYIRGMYVCTTMSPSLRLNIS